MPVPLLDLNIQNLALEAELKAVFERVLQSGQFILGKEVQSFESEAASMVGTKHAIGVSSGTDAILLALMALEIGPGDEVLCPSYTFFATAGCVARVGATPVFVDSIPETFNLDVADAAAKLTVRTKAIIPVHLFGQCADMDGVMDLARQHHLAVIEDAAQSLGARYKGRQAGSIGTFGAYSFFPSKNLGGFGDGGMLVTDDDTLGERARLLRTHGAKPKYYHKYIGANFRLDALQAALLRVKLPHCLNYNAKRRSNAAFYDEKLAKLPGVLLPKAESQCEHIWNQYTLRVVGPGKRDRLRDFLTERAIGSEIYYPVPLHEQECFSYTRQPARCENASLLASQALSIPVYPELTTRQLTEVAEAIADFEF